MNKAKRKRNEASGDAGAAIDPVGVLVRLLVPALLVARLLVPAEASVLGDTLGLVLLWFAAAVLWAWSCLRTSTLAVRVGWLDAALWLLVAGHAISTGSVFVIGGDRRAAVNMLWEWVALGVSFFLVRQTLVTRADAQRLLLVMSAAVVALAGQGIWQHYVTFPENVARYERLRALEESSPGSAEVQQGLAEMEVPQTPTSRILWEERLRSTEPFATMALANTLAGLLAAWLVVIVATAARESSGSRGWTGRIGPAVTALAVTFCLVLTKSRTAAVGACAGVAALAGLSLHSSQQTRKWIGAVLAGIVIVGVLLIAALQTGGLDRQVLSESPKSLRYRLQYWTGAAAVIRERPVFGTGPGNFRQHYLRHKLPESSEEILDPHNFLLDVWTSAGIVGVAGLLWLLVLGARALGRRSPEGADAKPAEPSETRAALWTPLTIGGGAGFAIVIAVHAVLGRLEEALIGVAGLWLIALWGLRRGFLGGSISAPATAAASLALLVHLLGAGGIEMPAVAQTLLVLLAAGSVLANLADHMHRQHRRRIAAMGLGAAVLFVLALLTAAGPVLQRQSLGAAGDLAAFEERNLQRAERLYVEAGRHDPLSPEPAERLADLAFARWARSPSDESFEAGVAYGEEAIRRDPFSANGYRRLGVWYLERFRGTSAPAAAPKAVAALTRATQRYPNSAVLRAELAEALSAAQDRAAARREARFALELDAVNRREGHRDKYLPDSRLEQLREIVGDTETRAD